MFAPLLAPDNQKGGYIYIYMRIQSIKCTAHYNHHMVSKCSQMASYTLTKVTAGQIAEGKREISFTLHYIHMQVAIYLMYFFK